MWGISILAEFRPMEYKLSCFGIVWSRKEPFIQICSRTLCYQNQFLCVGNPLKSVVNKSFKILGKTYGNFNGFSTKTSFFVSLGAGPSINNVGNWEGVGLQIGQNYRWIVLKIC